MNFVILNMSLFYINMHEVFICNLHLISYNLLLNWLKLEYNQVLIPMYGTMFHTIL